MSQTGRKKRQLSESPTSSPNTPTEDKRKCTAMTRTINNFGDLRDYLDNEHLNKVTEIIRAEVAPLQALVNNVQISITVVERKMESLEREINKKKLRLVGITEEKNETRDQLKAKWKHSSLLHSR
jgi:hypothetical protein